MILFHDDYKNITFLECNKFIYSYNIFHREQNNNIISLQDSNKIINYLYVDPYKSKSLGDLCTWILYVYTRIYNIIYIYIYNIYI